MRWLPLVAMVIASALPFPHDPASRLPAPSEDYGLGGNADRSRRDGVKASAHRETSAFREDGRTTHTSSSSSGSRDGRSLGAAAKEGPLRTEEGSEDRSPPKDYEGSRNNGSAFLGSADTSAHRPSPSGQHGDAWRSRTGAEDSLTPQGGPGLDSLLELDEMFLDAHPRVLFSPSPSPPEHPPLLLMLENGLMEEDGGDADDQDDLDGHIEGHGDRAMERSGTTPSWADYSRGAAQQAHRPVKRDKRSHLNDRRTGEKSVCESESVWVTDKTTAIDSYNQQVTVLQEIQTQTGPLKQYFYETRCRQAEQQSGPSRTRGAGQRSEGTGVAGAGCLGVDKKQWRSECKARQTYVRALSKDANNRMGWRWIRIDSSCVCVLLSRTNQGREVLTRRGRV